MRSARITDQIRTTPGSAAGDGAWPGSHTLAACPTAAPAPACRCRTRDPSARSSSAPGRSAPRSPCCSPAAGCARRCRRARPSRPTGCRPTARTRLPARASSCRASCASSSVGAGLARAEFVFLGVPSRGLDDVIGGLTQAGLTGAPPVVSLAKGLVPPDGRAPTSMLRERFGAGRVACIGGPAHAREMVREGAGLVAASEDEELAHALAAGVHPRGRRLRAVQRPGRRRARGRREERRRAGRRRDRGARASTPRAPPPGTSSPRSGATPRRRARGPSR